MYVLNGLFVLFQNCLKNATEECKTILKHKTRTNCMSKKNIKVSNKSKQGLLTCNLRVRIYKFKNHSANWYMRSSKKSSH